VAIHERPEAAAQPDRARHLPEIREEVLDLALEPVDVAPARHVESVPTRVDSHRMSLVGRILKALAAVLALLVYVWMAAVRGAPAAHRRRAAKRAARRLDGPH